MARLGGGNHNKSPEFSSGGIENLSAAILAGNHYASVVTQESKDMAKIYRIRKLTPRECGRLMGCSDADISKIENYPLVPDGKGDFVAPEGMAAADLKRFKISESQQYKMYGNSIVVQVLEGIFTQLFRADSDCLF